MLDQRSQCWHGRLYDKRLAFTVEPHCHMSMSQVSQISQTDRLVCLQNLPLMLLAATIASAATGQNDG